MTFGLYNFKTFMFVHWEINICIKEHWNWTTSTSFPVFSLSLSLSLSLFKLIPLET